MAYEGSNSNAVTLASASKWFKNWYINKGMLNRLMYKDKFLGRLKRLPATVMVGGNKIIVPVRVGRSPSASHTFSVAQTQAKARTGARENWQLDTHEDYGVIRVSDKAILASRQDRGAFVRLLKDEADSAILGMQQRWCTALFASDDNAIGKVGARAGSTVTFASPADVVNVDINDAIAIRSPAGANRAGGPWYVEKVNRATGVLTLATAIGSAVVVNDLIYRDGDYGATAVTGFGKWIPSALPTTTLNGIDRTIDPIRLGGHRIAMSATDKFDSVVRKMAARINHLCGENPTIAVMNPLVDQVVSEELTDKIRYSDSSGKGAGSMAEVGQGALSFKTGGGRVEVVTTPFCPNNTIYLLTESDVALYYLADEGGDLVFMVKGPDGGLFEKAHDSAGIEGRLESFGNCGITNPGLHGRITLHSGKVPQLS